MTKHKTLRRRNNVDCLHLSRNEGGRGLVCIEDSVDTSIRKLYDYIKKGAEEDWLF